MRAPESGDARMGASGSSARDEAGLAGASRGQPGHTSMGRGGEGRGGARVAAWVAAAPGNGGWGLVDGEGVVVPR